MELGKGVRGKPSCLFCCVFFTGAGGNVKGKKSKFHKCHYVSLICISFTVFFSVLGVAYAAWTEGLSVKGTVTTGYIDPVFSECEVIKENSESNLADSIIENGGKTLRLFISNAYPGYAVTFQYAVKNRGSIPVECSPVIKNDNPGITVTLDKPAGVVGGFDDSKTGLVTLSVDTVEENTEYFFTTELIFQQWDAVK